MGEITRRELSSELQEDLIFSKDNISSLPVDVEIEGRTLVNLLGRAGNAIYSPSWAVTDNSTLTMSADSFILRQTQKGFVSHQIPCDPETYYLLIAEVKNSDTAYITTSNIVTSNHVTANSGNHVLCALNSEQNSVMSIALCPDKLNEDVVFKNVRAYKISSDDYELIINSVKASNDIESICEKYPYVDDVKCIVNPYIECKENLLTPSTFQKGAVSADYEANTDPYIINLTSRGFGLGLKAGTYSFWCSDDSKYSLWIGLRYRDDHVDRVHDWVGASSQTFSADEDCEACVLISIKDNGKTIEDVDKLLQDLMLDKVQVTLVRGSEPKSYSECDNSRIMFETKLYEGEKITRRNDGVYIKNSEWDEVAIEPSIMINPRLHTSSADKRMKHINTGILAATYDIPELEYIAIKYDGTIIDSFPNQGGTVESTNEFIKTRLHEAEIGVQIPNTLSGWGPNYTPTQEEIRAFFLGWKMYNGSGSGGDRFGVYNGTSGEAKCWIKLWCGVGSRLINPSYPHVNGSTVDGSQTSVCPTAMNDQGYTPYRLIYKKETPSIEELKVHGNLAVKAGVDVVASSGLVLNEIRDVDIISDGFEINGYNAPCKNKVESFIRIRNVKSNQFYNMRLNWLGHKAEYLIKVGRYNVSAYDPSITSNTEIAYDYHIIQRDTVTSYRYSLTTPKTLKESTAKAIQELAACYEKLAITERELERAQHQLHQSSNPNLLINGDFQVWQRGESFASGLAGYCADRWERRRLSQTSSKTSNGIKIVGGTQGHGICQYIEAEKLLGKRLTLSIKFKTISESVLVRPCKRGWASIAGRTFYTNSAGKVESFSFTVPNELQDNILIILIDSAVATEHTFEIEWVKLEVGEYATPFVPRSYAEELALCQRYYEKVKGVVSVGSAVSGSTNYCSSIPFLVEKRIPPTIKYTQNPNLINVKIVEISHMSHNSTELSKAMFEPMINLNGTAFSTGMQLIVCVDADAEIY